MIYVEQREGAEEVRVIAEDNLVPEGGSIIHRLAEGIAEQVLRPPSRTAQSEFEGVVGRVTRHELRSQAPVISAKGLADADGSSSGSRVKVSGF